MDNIKSYDTNITNELVLTTSFHISSYEEHEQKEEGEFIKVHKFKNIVTSVVELNDIVATYFKNGNVNIGFQLISKGRNNSWPVHRVTTPLHLQLIIQTKEGGTLHRWDVDHVKWGCSTNERKYYESSYPNEMFEYIAKSTIPGTTFSTHPRCS